MFRWKDYEENACLFIKGIDTNVAVLRYKDFQLTDATTGNKFKMKSSCIEEAKVDAENFLKEYWKRVQKDINKIMDKISWWINSFKERLEEQYGFLWIMEIFGRTQNI